MHAGHDPHVECHETWLMHVNLDRPLAISAPDSRLVLCTLWHAGLEDGFAVRQGPDFGRTESSTSVIDIALACRYPCEGHELGNTIFDAPMDAVASTQKLFSQEV